MGTTSVGGVSRRSAVAALAVALIALLWMCSGAKAAELLYWDNYGENGLAFSNLDGNGGGSLSLAGAELASPEGMAYDSVSSRIFVTSQTAPKGQIIFVNLDGTGAGVFGTPGAVVGNPKGLAIDPATRTLYWINTKAPESIGWAKLDGSAGGLLNTSGATLAAAYRLSIDPVAGRLYWGNTAAGKEGISYAALNNTGGGNLSLVGATVSGDFSGLAVVPSLGRIYWINGERISFASLGGAGGGDLNLTGAKVEGDYGLAIDPATSKLYWGNYAHHTGENVGAFSFGNLGGGGGVFNIATSPVDAPQDPLILKSPSATAAPLVTRGNTSRTALSCSPGVWAADLPGSSVYQAPRTLAYQWTVNGRAIPGASASTLTADAPGSYVCTVIATNQAGSGSQASGAVVVVAAKLRLTVKAKKVKVKPGKPAVFRVQALNQGDLRSKPARLCVVVPKPARKAIIAPKCKKIQVKSQGKPVSALLVKTTVQASGTYNLKIVVRGAPGKAAKVKLQIVG